jgi:hypothetical protein
VWIRLAAPRLEQLQLGLFTPRSARWPPATVAVVNELAEQLQLGAR